MTNTDRDGDCFYHAIISYLAPSAQLSIVSLRGALADYAEHLRTQVYQGGNRLQYIIDNIGALENSFCPLLGYQGVALQDIDAVYRGIIRNIRGYLIANNRGDDQDRAALHEILHDANAINNWSPRRQALILLAQNFVQTGVRPALVTVPTPIELEIN